jgi:nitrogen fixation-related uncharacterized protein
MVKRNLLFVFICVVLIIVSLFLSGCQNKSYDDLDDDVKLSTADVKMSDEKDVKIDDVKVYENEMYNGEIEGVKGEIDYWYKKGGREIGKEHYTQLKERLEKLDKKISEEDMKEYFRRLNAIKLIDDPMYVKDMSTSSKVITKEEQEKMQKKADLEGCEGEGVISFTSAPMRVEEIEMIQPIGLMIGGHVTPIDHGYYSAKKWKSFNVRKVEEFVDVIAPGDGVVMVYSMPAEFRSSSIGDYRLILYHTCTFYTIYIHVNQLSEKLMKIVDTGSKVKVNAGEVIGRAPGFDFSVHNTQKVLSGFVVPESYVGEDWKIHTIDMFEVFAEPLRSQLLARNARQVLPRGGKIDYDVDGKLIGNWFEEGTNAYTGKKEYNRMPGYWKTHVAFAPDAYDPSLFVVSLGDFGGEAKQFAAKGNDPDPTTIEVGSGIVKYELVAYDYKTDKGEYWNRVSYAKVVKAEGGLEVQGVVLVQMLEKRKLKLEVFVGKKAGEVSGFTSNARVYVR